jgi:hypothetical protein
MNTELNRRNADQFIKRGRGRPRKLGPIRVATPNKTINANRQRGRPRKHFNPICKSTDETLTESSVKSNIWAEETEIVLAKPNASFTFKQNEDSLNNNTMKTLLDCQDKDQSILTLKTYDLLPDNEKPVINFVSIIKENEELKLTVNKINSELFSLREAYNKLKAELNEKDLNLSAALYQVQSVNDKTKQYVQDYLTSVNNHLGIVFNSYTANFQISQLLATNERLQYVSNCLWLRKVVKSILKKTCDLLQIDLDNINEYTMMKNASLDTLKDRLGRLTREKLFDVLSYLKGVKEVCNNVAHVDKKFPVELMDNKKDIADFFKLLGSYFSIKDDISVNLSLFLNKIGFSMEDANKNYMGK